MLVDRCSRDVTPSHSACLQSCCQARWWDAERFLQIQLTAVWILQSEKHNEYLQHQICLIFLYLTPPTLFSVLLMIRAEEWRTHCLIYASFIMMLRNTNRASSSAFARYLIWGVCCGIAEMLTFVFVLWCLHCCGNLQPLDTDHQQPFFIRRQAWIHVTLFFFMLISYCLTPGLDFFFLYQSL